MVSGVGPFGVAKLAFSAFHSEVQLVPSQDLSSVMKSEACTKGVVHGCAEPLTPYQDGSQVHLRPAKIRLNWMAYPTANRLRIVCSLATG